MQVWDILNKAGEQIIVYVATYRNAVVAEGLQYGQTEGTTQLKGYHLAKQSTPYSLIAYSNVQYDQTEHIVAADGVWYGKTYQTVAVVGYGMATQTTQQQ